MSSLFGSGASSSSTGMSAVKRRKSVEADHPDMTARKEQMKQSIVQEVSLFVVVTGYNGATYLNRD